MKKKLKELLDVLLPIYIIINLLFILVGSYLILIKYLNIKIFSYMYILLLIINVFIILFIFLKKKYKKKKIDIFLLLIIIFAVISTIFAYKPMKALFGEWGRYEGLFVICYYMTLVFITSYLKKEDRKIIVYSILVFGFIQCIYAICQKLDLFNVQTMIHKGDRWATGFCTNPNFFGTLMILCLSYSIGLYIDAKEKISIILFSFLTTLFTIGLYISDTLSSFIGFIVVIILLLIYALKTKKIKKYIILFSILLFTSLVIQKLNLTTLFKDLNKTKSEITQISKGDLNNNYGTGRMEIYKKTIKIVPNYIIHGIGIDNFANVLDGKPITRVTYKKVYVTDKAHNEYLQILVTMGIFSLISYLCLHFLIVKEGIKSTLKNNEIYYLLPVIGYIVQAQFNISVIEVAPIFYIALGLLVDRN